MQGCCGVVRKFIPFLAIPFLFSAAPRASAQSAEDIAFFKTEVLPILEQACLECHSAEKQKGGFRMDSKNALLRGGDKGVAVIPGDPDKSLLVQAIRRDGKLKMPPEEELFPNDVKVLTEWVRRGLPWPEDHNAAAAPVAVEAKARTVPVVTLAIESGAPVKFDTDIRPLIADRCFACHGPDAAERKAGLRLDDPVAATTPLASGHAAIVPGSLEKSQLFQRIAAVDAGDRMPPSTFHKSLNETEIRRIGQWILQGAKWEAHWAFVAPVRPEPPKVARTEWVRNPIDNFVLARLDAEGLTPAGEADRRTLIRRLSFDLTGLPPSVEEVHAFVKDKRKDAYERLVDRLLDSPQYGENMARYWLDAARYADTNGYHIDNMRFMWRWRDWVINAFNANMPFDQFTIEQLAGDLLPNATEDQKIASGFNRNHMINFEGGAIPEEYRTAYVMDRVDTTSTVWMGLTMHCAQCHDHKYDPISRRDYYQMYAYFNSIAEQGLDANNGNAVPMMQAPMPVQAARLTELDKRTTALAERLKVSPEREAAFAKWLETDAPSYVNHWTLITPSAMTSSGAATLTRQDDGTILVTGENAAKDVYELSTEIAQQGITAIRLEALQDPSMPKSGPGRAGNGNFVLTGVDLEIIAPDKPDAPQKIKFRSAFADHSQKDFHVSKAIDGDTNSGWAADADTKPEPRHALFVAEAPFNVDAGARVVIRLRHESGFANHGIGHFRLTYTTDAMNNQGIPPAAALALAQPADQRRPEQADAIRTYYLRQNDADYGRVAEERDWIEYFSSSVRKRVPSTMVMGELEQTRPTFMLRRGQYDQPEDEVKAATPGFLPAMPATLTNNRLGFAKWLVSAENPLTARVTVNRLWQQFFGVGIVRTAEDFGTQGARPTNPELLDWLATEFVANGWNVKDFVRLIVTSSTYRQSARPSAEAIAKDPENQLYARGPRFRLDAEQVRDNALMLGGLLVDTIGGESVYPYQPEGLWEEVSYKGGFSAQFYAQGIGPAQLYRRSMYIFWKRTSPPPTMMIFDAPNRENCTVRRGRTNTPLQALVLMNDPQFVEAARAFAERVLLEGGTAEHDRLNYAFEIATARVPEVDEAQILLSLLEQQKSVYLNDAEAAKVFLEVGDRLPNEALDPAELAAWTVITSTLLNLDETITKG